MVRAGRPDRRLQLAVSRNRRSCIQGEGRQTSPLCSAAGTHVPPVHSVGCTYRTTEGKHTAYQFTIGQLLMFFWVKRPGVAYSLACVYLRCFITFALLLGQFSFRVDSENATDGHHDMFIGKHILRQTDRHKAEQSAERNRNTDSLAI